MSDNDELPLWKKRRLLDMQRRLLVQKAEQEAKPEQPKRTLTSEEKVLALYAGRAKEVHETAKRQFPDATKKVIEALARLVDRGELTGPISGEELYAFLQRLGIRVRLPTTISYVENGKTKSIAEKIRQS
ncbi:MAG: hypothetical protein V1857_05510 [archaeon]